MMPDELAEGEITALKLLGEAREYCRVVWPYRPSKYAVVEPSSSYTEPKPPSAPGATLKPRKE